MTEFYRKPRFQAHELEMEFQQHKKYSDGLRKIIRKKTVPKHAGKHGLLPPLSHTVGLNDSDI